MTALSIDVVGLLDVLGDLPRHAETAAGDAPPGHPFFGALFLFVGSLLVVELLAGQVYQRSRVLTMLWPAALMGAGLGMLIVTYVQPDEKALHLGLAFLLLLGGLVEARCRLGQMPRVTADTVQVPAFLLGGLVIGPLHANGALMSSVIAQTHLLVGLVGFALAGVRTLQVRHGGSAALDASFGVGVMLLGLSLLLVQQFHSGH